MNRISYGIFISSALALVVGACSSSDAAPVQPAPDGSTSGGGKSGAGGTSGTGGRSSGGAAGSPAAPDAGPPVSCGSASCNGLVILGMVSLNACCSATTHCGLDSTPAAAFAPNIPKGCIETHQPGADTAQCPERDVSVVTNFHFKGCCRPEGQCGLHADITGSVPGLDFGCVKPEDFGVSLEGGALPSCTPSKADGGGSGGAPADAGPG